MTKYFFLIPQCCLRLDSSLLQSMDDQLWDLKAHRGSELRIREMTVQPHISHPLFT